MVSLRGDRGAAMMSGQRPASPAAETEPVVEITHTATAQIGNFDALRPIARNARLLARAR
jgi:hypothetical protein